MKPQPRPALDITNPPDDWTAISASPLDDRSAVYAAPDPQRVPLPLDNDARARLAHLEGMVTALLGEVEELKKRLDDKEADS